MTCLKYSTLCYYLRVFWWGTEEARLCILITPLDGGVHSLRWLFVDRHCLLWALPPEISPLRPSAGDNSKTPCWQLSRAALSEFSSLQSLCHPNVSDARWKSQSQAASQGWESLSLEHLHQLPQQSLSVSFPIAPYACKLTRGERKGAGYCADNGCALWDYF